MMANQLVIKEKTLNKIPYVWLFFIILILGLPAVGVEHNVKFSKLSLIAGYEHLMKETLIQSNILFIYVTETVLQWTTFSLALICSTIAFNFGRLANDKVAFVMGLSILFSGLLCILPIIMQSNVLNSMDKVLNLNSFIWFLSNSMSGLIMLVGILWILHVEKVQKKSKFHVYLLISFLLVAAFALVYYAIYQIKIPQMWFENLIISRPYELISLSIYLFILIYLYPKLYRKKPTILSNTLFYMSVTQCVMVLYILLLSTYPYDNAYIIANVVKFLFYVIPLNSFIVIYASSYRDVLKSKTTLEKNKRELDYLVTHDILTNLSNRREFDSRFSNEMRRFESHHKQFALIIVDIDKFKGINDTFGHYTGDSIIKNFSQRLKTSIRKEDIVARIGGDEFAIILPGINSELLLKKALDRIIKKISKPYSVENKLIPVTASIGIALCPANAKDKEILFKCADNALYEAKKLGGNTFKQSIISSS